MQLGVRRDRPLGAEGSNPSWERKAPERSRAATCDYVAEREGFEPSVRLPVHMISSHAPSASRSPLLRPDGLAGERGRGYVTQNGRSAETLHPAERVGFEPTVRLPVRL